MDPRSFQYFCAAAEGVLRSGMPDREVLRVVTDSRTVRPGDLFVGLAGESFDGHDFVSGAFERGALACVVNRGRIASVPPGAGWIEVTDTRCALRRMAARYRADFDLPVVAVAGSNGKTSTKNLLAAALGAEWPVLASEASFNNDIGVPLTLLRLERTHRAAVVEMGTNHPGELAPLVELAQPRLGVMTSLGREHLEHFKDFAGVVAEEGTLAELLSEAGTLVVSLDSPGMDQIVRRTRARVVSAGLEVGNDWRATVKRTDSAGTQFEVRAPKTRWSGEYQLRLIGRHMVANAALALAVAAELGVRPTAAKRGLAECPPAKMRLNLIEIAGVCLVDDAYNANADSMIAALKTLSDLPCAGRRVAVLGDMAELGGHAEAAHREAGQLAAAYSVDRLMAIGQFASVIAQTARAAGVRQVTEVPDVESAIRLLRNELTAGDTVLIKASRSSRLERVVEALKLHLGGHNATGSLSSILAETRRPVLAAEG